MIGSGLVCTTALSLSLSLSLSLFLLYIVLHRAVVLEPALGTWGAIEARAE